MTEPTKIRITRNGQELNRELLITKGHVRQRTNTNGDSVYKIAILAIRGPTTAFPAERFFVSLLTCYIAANPSLTSYDLQIDLLLGSCDFSASSK